MLTYERDPEAIYRSSFATIQREVDFAKFPEAMHAVVERVVHASGQPEMADRLAFSDDAAESGMRALKGGAPIFVDVEMVRSGIIRRFLPADNAVECTLYDPRTREVAAQIGNTRSAAAVELWKDRLEGAVVAIGNAPTALFHLLEIVLAGGPKPALIVGVPVGFVGAAESKHALETLEHGVPFITLRGRPGGSSLAAATLNALSKQTKDPVVGTAGAGGT